jgi:hypothetical protein
MLPTLAVEEIAIMPFDNLSDDEMANLRDREAVHAECEDWGEDRVQAYVDAHPDDAERVHRLEWLNLKARAANKQVADPEWGAMSPKIRRAIKASWESGMPPMASALYGRWWQLETWLRSLIYVELKAALGGKWVEALRKTSEDRQLKEHGFRYMATPDAQNRLAYTDASLLFKIMQENWTLFISHSRYAAICRMAVSWPRIGTSLTLCGYDGCANIRAQSSNSKAFSRVCTLRRL